jgi:hypothetical protein
MPVHAVLAGPVDTGMSPRIDLPMASPESVARAILDGVENGDEDIFPDPVSEPLAEAWPHSAPKALERQLAALAQTDPINS